MKLAVTFSPPNNPVEMFTNGIRQNVLYFSDMLAQSGHDVRFLVEEKEAGKLKGLYGINPSIRPVMLDRIAKEKFDIVFQVGFQIPNRHIQMLKDAGRSKIVSYKCGNDFIFDMEHVLFEKEEKGHPQYSLLSDMPGVFDQIWMIPQMTNSCGHYWSTLYRTRTVEAPFIWSSQAITQYEKDLKKSVQYSRREKLNRVAIFEPNINVVKWFFPALLVCENAHRAGHTLEHVYVTNTNNEKMGRLNLKQVNRIVKSLDLTKQKRISIEARYNSLFFISKYADLAVSWQMENPLNYLYLDLAWMGWPIIHNAHLCKDVGYYYEGFNYAQGGQVLGDAMAVHDGDVTYMDRQRAMIERYLPTNKLLQKKYERLLEGVVGAQGSQPTAAPAPSTETQGPGA